MARNMYGATSADFTLTSGGRIVPGATMTIWSERTGGTQITDLLDRDSAAATTVTSGADGSILYYGPNNDKTVHWADTGVGSRVAVRPVDITGDPPVLSIGTVGTGAAAANLTGTSEAPVLNLTLPTAGANGVNTAAIQDGAVTTVKIADGAVTPAKLDRIRQRVTHPNTTDTLIEVWDDGAGAWVVSDYDSGWRNVSSLLSNAAKFQTWDKVVMRRVGAQVQVTVRATVGTGTASGTTAGFNLFTIPTGFVPVEYSSYGYAQTGFSGLAPNLSSIHNMSTLNVLALGNVSSNWNNGAFGTVTWFTGATLPASLPGTPA